MLKKWLKIIIPFILLWFIASCSSTSKFNFVNPRANEPEFQSHAVDSIMYSMAIDGFYPLYEWWYSREIKNNTKTKLQLMEKTKDHTPFVNHNSLPFKGIKIYLYDNDGFSNPNRCVLYYNKYTNEYGSLSCYYGEDELINPALLEKINGFLKYEPIINIENILQITKFLIHLHDNADDGTIVFRNYADIAFQQSEFINEGIINLIKPPEIVENNNCIQLHLFCMNYFNGYGYELYVRFDGKGLKVNTINLGKFTEKHFRW